MRRIFEPDQESMNTRASSEIASILLKFESMSDGSGWRAGSQEVREVIPSTDAAMPARTQGQGNPAACRAQGAGPVIQPGQDKANAAHAALFPQALRVPPATPRWGFTVAAFDLLRLYAKCSFPGNTQQRAEFEKSYPEAAGMGALLDVADIVLRAVDEVECVRQRHRREDAKLAAKRRAKRREGGRR